MAERLRHEFRCVGRESYDLVASPGISGVFVGDKIDVRISLRGSDVTTHLPVCSGIVTEIDERHVHFRYCDDSPVFAGLNGMIRLRPRKLSS